MTEFTAELQESLKAFRQGNLSLARDYAETILRRDKGNPGALRLLGQIEFLDGKIEGAISFMEKSLALKPEQYSLWVKLGNLYAEKGLFEKSDRAYTRALDHSPDPHLALFWRAQARFSIGQKENAFADLTQALAFNSLSGQTYRLMVNLGHPDCLKKEFIANLAGKVSGRLFPREDMIHAHYALAGIYEKTRDRIKLWHHLSAANGLQNNSASAWEKAYREIAGRSREIFTREFLKSPSSPAKLKTTPIFIVGFPRSGSTLLEKMLSSHPMIAGGGETDLMPKLIGKIQEETLLGYPNGLETLEPESFTELAGFYLEAFSKRVKGAKFGTDKLLSNTFFLGLIVKLFPKARIIYIKRDPLDTAFSIYKNYFWEARSPEFCSLEAIGKYFLIVEDLMAFWRAEGVSFHDVQYEDLVSSPEKIMKPLLAYLGVPWDEKCLDHRNSATVADTISLSQMEDPLSAKSVGSGKAFEKEMAPFLKVYGKE